MATLSQGLHIDPEHGDAHPPDPAKLTVAEQEAWASPLLETFREGLRLDGIPDVRAAILDDLSTYYGFTPEECVQRCLHWEEWSIAEWKAGDRSSTDGLTDFYNSTVSWSFDLLWYAYLQATGFGRPVSVMTAVEAARRGKGPGAQHLDFGAGVGATAQLFSALGYTTTLADISTTLQAFARFRLERRGQSATFIDLNTDSLPADSYDVVTAFDVLVHVPDIVATANELHTAMRPGGILFANFDVRPPSDANAWHLYADAAPLEYALRRAGFVRRGSVAGIWAVYERVEPRGAVFAVRSVRDLLLYRWGLRHRLGRIRRALGL